MAEQVASLKKKKGQESEVKESQEKAAEIIKEIKALRSLKLDQVTMTALQENVDLEKDLQDPQAIPVDRAIAHIATHSRFINKLQKVKEAIKEERAKAAEAEQKKTDKLDMVQSKNEDEEPEEEPEEDEESEEEPEEGEEPEEDEEPEDDHNSVHSEDDGDVVEEKLNSPVTEIHTSSVAEPTESTDSDLVKVPPSKIITTSPEKSKRVEVKSQKAEATAPNVRSSPEKSSTVSKKNIGKASKEMETTLKPQKKKDLPETKRDEAEKDKEESDLSDEEEKEYFDDSTEERFHKQSSQSEESDDDDFFLGKVSKFKKRKSNQSKVEEKKSELQKTDKEATGKHHETNLGKFQSVFCSALSKSSVSSQKAKVGSHSDGPRPSRFQNQRKGPEGRMKASQYKVQDLGADRRMGPFKPNRQTFKVAEQKQAGPSGAGRGRPQFEQKRNPRGPPGRMSDPPQQSLHPSWEASRKRKEQQAQITVFQGKKIRFDDDDDDD